MVASADFDPKAAQYSVSLQTSAEGVLVPGSDWLLSAQFGRSGHDLVIHGADGKSAIVPRYFATDEPASLITESGARLDGALVELLAGSRAPLQWAEAQVAQASDASGAIGEVRDVQGVVQVSRADGSQAQLAQGDAVFLGDVIQAAPDGKILIAFVDGTTFALSDGARMTLDDLVFNPGGSGNVFSASVLQGTFIFLTGQIAPSGSMDVTTPVGTIGVRGTKVVCKLAVEGAESTITLLVDPSGHVGIVEVTNAGGTRILDQANEATRVVSFFIQPSEPVILSQPELLQLFDDVINLIDQQNQTGPGNGNDTGSIQGPQDAAAGADDVTMDAAAEAAAAFQTAAGEPVLIPADQFIGLPGAPIPSESFLSSVTYVVANYTFDFAPSAVGESTFSQEAVTSDTSHTRDTEKPVTPPPSPSPFTIISGGSGNDTLSGGPGRLQVVGNGGDDALTGGDLDDILDGGDGDDTLDPGPGDDNVQGGPGNDLIIGGSGAGNDTLNGGADTDTVKYQSATQDIDVNLTTGKASGDPAIGIDTLVNIENVTGGSGNDTIVGNGASNELDGGAGDDAISGLGGNDTLVGGAGDDELTGGAGNDLLEGGGNVDTAVLSGNRADYIVTVAGGQLVLTDQRAGGDGTDTLEGIESVKFADQQVSASDLTANPPSDIELSNLTVAENAVGAVIGIVTVADPDVGDTHTLTVSDDRFEVLGGELKLRAGESLDFEAEPLVTLEITAKDSGGLSRTESFTIGVTNENELGPVTDSDTAVNTVVATAGIGTVVGVTGLAIDPDAGDTVSYNLTDSDGGLFAIASGTGVVTVAGALTAGDHQIEITATDNHGLSRSEIFTIHVTNTPPSIPVDANATANEVAENAANGSPVGITASSTDPDAGDVVTYSLSDSAGGRFAIDAGTGAVTVADGSLLDFEGATSHEITVRATSNGGLFSEQTFTIAVTNVNETTTDIALSNASVAENAAGAVIGAVTVTDPDAEDTHTLTVSDDRFEIVGGELRLKAGESLDFEAEPTVTLEITAKDSGGLSRTESFAIAVTNGNEVPTDIELSNLTVAENVVGAVIGAVTVTDSDAGDTHSFTVSDVRFEVVGGQLALKAGESLDFEAEPSVALEITAKDSGGLSRTETFTITVTDVNETPTDIQLSNLTVAENAVGAIIGAVTVIDPDAVDIHTLTVSDARFEIVGGELKLKPGESLDFEAEPTVEVDITATDRGGLSRTETFTISVTNVNEAPSDIQLSNLTVAENSAGAVIGAVTVTDPDAGDAHTLAVSDDRFEIVDGELKLKAGESLDFETEPTVEVDITATDRGGLSRTETFTIAVADGEPPSDIELSNLTVAENAAGAVIGAVTVADPDTGDTHTLTVSDGRFEVLDGELKLRAGESLDFEAEPTVTLEITATDSGGLSRTETFTIAVTNVNEVPTDIQLSNLTVAENAIGAVIGALSVTDPDAGDTHSFTLSDARFEIVGGELKLKAGESLDFETEPSVTLEITAKDSGGLSRTETFTIAVTNVNEVPTDIQLSNLTVAENSAGAVIGAVTVLDPDAGNTHTLTVSDDRFEVAGGELKLKAGKSLDFETEPSVTLEITATDGGGLSRTESFTIAVGDGAENNLPTDIQLSNLTVAENSAGAVIGVVTVLDPDAGDTHTLAVSDDRFEIVGGQLTLKAGESLDFEAEPTVEVDVTATDAGGLSRTETFTIAVTNVNEAPAITSNGGLDTAAVSVVENSTAVTDVNAQDPDAGAALSFTIAGGADSGLFDIDALTGALSFKTAPDFEAPEDADGDNVYDVIVQVSDGALTDTQAIAVTVTKAGVPAAVDDFAIVNEDQQAATNGAAMKTTATVAAGAVLTLQFNFLDSEPPTDEAFFKDFAVVVIDGQVFKLADVDDATSPVGAVTTDFDDQTGYLTFTFTFTASGTYDLGFAVLNEGDTAFDAGLLVDSVSISGGSFSDGFESGLGGWVTLGDVTPQGTFEGIAPAAGSQQALLVSNGAEASAIESFLGLAPGTLVNTANQPVITGNVLDNDAFGTDGPGGIVGIVYTGNPTDVDDPNGTTDGDITTIIAADGSWRLELDLASGDYSFTVLAPIDHPAGSDSLAFTFAYTIEDATGDSSEAILEINVVDGVPFAVDDPEQVVTVGGDDIAGNVLADDQLSPDGVAVTEILLTGGSGPVAVPASGSLTVTTTLGGTLTISADGNWSYAPPAILPGTGAVEDGFTYTVTDGDGDQSSAAQSILVQPDGTNLPPSDPVDDDLTANTVAQDAAAGTLVGVDVSSIDPEGQVVSFALDDPSGQFQIDETTGLITTATVPLVAGSYEVTVFASDASGESSTATFTIEVTEPFAPSIDLDAGAAGTGYATTFAEGGPAVRIADGDALITDPDDTNLEQLTVQVSPNLDGGFEILSLTAEGQALADSLGLTVGGSGTPSLFIVGTATVANYQALLREVLYENLSDTPTPGVHQVLVQAHDGTSFSNLATASVTVVADDADQPVIDLDASAAGQGYLTTFTEGGPAVHIADGDALITDPDDTNLEQLTVQVSPNLDGGFEILSLTAEGQALADSLGLTVGGGGTPSLFIVGTATVANYQALLREIVYENLSDTPTPGVHQVLVQAHDGTNVSNLATATVTVVADDADQPVIDLDAGAVGTGYQTTFTEGGPAVRIADGDALIADPDDTHLEQLTVQVSPNLDGGSEVLSLTTAGQTLATSLGLTVGGSGTPSLFIVGTATVANYQALLREVVYENQSDTPTPGEHQILVQTHDGTNVSNLATATVTVVADDADHPSVDLDASVAGTGHAATFTEGGPAVHIAAGDAVITDPDDTHLEQLTVQVSPNPDGFLEQLSLTTAGQAEATRLGLSVSGSGTPALFIVGTATVADYQALLRQVVYENQSDTPTPGVHQVLVQAHDGTNFSDLATTTVTVVGGEATPILVANSLIVARGGTNIVQPSELETTDADSPPNQLVYALAAMPALGTLLLGGVPLALGGTFTQQDINSGLLQYIQDGPPVAVDSFVVDISDGTHTLSGQSILINVVQSGHVADGDTTNPNDSDPLIVGDTAYGRLDIVGDGDVGASLGITVGQAATGDGLIRMEGAGATLTTEGFGLEVGDAGKGSLLVSSGAVVTVGPSGANQLLIGNQAGSEGFVLVRDIGSLVQTVGTDNGIQVGVNGIGVLTVEDGGRVTTLKLVVGANGGSAGSVLIDGDANGAQVVVSNDDGLFSGSDHDLAGRVVVGDAGAGVLDVVNGGDLVIRAGEGVNSDTVNPMLAIGHAVGSVGTVQVSGTGSTIALSMTAAADPGDIYDLLRGPGIAVGLKGTGAMTVQQGAAVTLEGDEAFVDVGVGNYLDPDDETAYPTASLNVIDGGTLSLTGTTGNDGGLIIGDFQGGHGIVNVIGPSSAISIASDGGASVGREGGGTLNVLAGGQVEIHSDQFNNLEIGEDISGVGAVTVSGAGSKIVTTGTNNAIHVGRSGEGSLEIENGGSVTAQFVEIGRYAGSQGELVVSGAGAQLVTAGLDNSIHVGWQGAGSLMVDDKAFVKTLNLVVGREGSGTVVVDGPDARVVVSSDEGLNSEPYTYEAGFVRVSRNAGSSGSLTITNGAELEIRSGIGQNEGTYAAALAIGRDKGSSGHVLVSGPGSLISITQEVVPTGPLKDHGPYARLQGDSTLTVQDQGEVVIEGVYASLRVGDARYADAHLEVVSGGSILIDSKDVGGGLFVGGAFLGAATGTVHVGGDGSSITVKGDGSRIVIGQDSTGSLLIDGKGLVEGEALSAGQYAGGTGDVTVSGVQSTLKIDGDNGIQIGVDGSGELHVAGGATVLSSSDNFSNLDIAAGGNGFGWVTVDGAGSLIQTFGIDNTVQVGRYGEGKLDVTNGGVVSTLLFEVGRSGTGTATISGPGSKVIASNDGGLFGAPYAHEAGFVRVGRDDGSSGTLTLINGGVLEVRPGASAGTYSAGLQIARDAGSSGIVSVTGPGSAIVISGDDAFLEVGRGGTGELQVLAGGSVSTLSMNIGRTGSGTVTVDGDGSKIIVSNDGGLFLGDDKGYAGFVGVGRDNGSDGHLNITGGGRVEIRPGELVNQDTIGATLSIGRYAGSTGVVSIGGKDSALIISGDDGFLQVGRYGHGELHVSGGGLVSTLLMEIGRYGESTGIVTIDGPGSRIIASNDGGLFPSPDEEYAGFVRVGREYGSEGHLTITNGGVLEIRPGETVNTNTIYAELQIARDAGSVGTVVVNGKDSGSGQASSILMKGDGSFAVVGRDGDGSLNVENGGLVKTLNLEIGRHGSGHVTVNGSGSAIIVSNDDGLRVGPYSGNAGSVVVSSNDGSGVLEVTGGGLLEIRPGLTENTDTVRPMLAVGNWSPASTGQVLVSGPDSRIRILQNVVSPDGPGSFSGAFVALAGGQALLKVENEGQLSIEGPGANFGVGGGVGTEGNLQVLSGGTILLDGKGQEAGLFVGGESGASGSVLISGAGSSITILSGTGYQGIAHVGYATEGTITVTNGGELRVVDGSGFGDGVRAWEFGRLDGGGGTVVSNVAINGILSATTDAVAQMTIDGNLWFDGGTLEVDASGASRSDRYDVSGQVDIGNSVFEFNFLPGYLPQAGDNFVFLHSATIVNVDFSSMEYILHGISAGGVFGFNIASDGNNLTFASLVNTTASDGLIYRGSSDDDVFAATTGSDEIHGEDGADQLSGGAGNDFIAGGSGVDALDGGTGADSFFYRLPSDGTQIASNGLVSSFDATGDLISNFDATIGTGDKLVFNADAFNIVGISSLNFSVIGVEYDGTNGDSSAYLAGNPSFILDSQNHLIYDENSTGEGYTVIATVDVATGSPPITADNLQAA